MRLRLLPFAVCVCLAAGCGRETSPPSADAPIPLKISYQPYISYAPLLIAQEEGYFAEQGLQVEFVHVERMNTALPLLAEGKLDVVEGTASAGLMNAIARGARIRVVADKGRYTRHGPPYSGLVATRALAAKGLPTTPDGWRQLRCSSQQDNTAGMFFERALIRLGADPKDIQMVYLPTPARLEALGKGVVDLGSMTEPWLTRSLADADCVLMASDFEVLPDFQLAMIAFGPSLLDKNPEAGTRFLMAFLKGVRQYNQGKTDRNVEIIVRHTQLDPELVRQTGWPPCQEDGRINVESLLEFQDWLVGKKMLDRRLQPEEFWEPRLVEAAVARLRAGQEAAR